MNFLARIAIGLVLCSVAAPTVSLADTNPHKQNARKSQTSKSVKSSWAWRSGAHAVLAGAGNPHWVSVAQRYKGTNPTGRRSLWCADFMNLVLQRSGMQGTSSSTARSFASYGKRLSGPKVGAIAVLSRGKGGGHVGIVTGIDSKGNPILLSGNHNNTVAEAAYSANRIIAYVWPAS